MILLSPACSVLQPPSTRLRCAVNTHIAVMTFSMMATSDTTISLSDTFRSRPFAHAQFALHFRLHHHCAILCAWVEHWLQTDIHHVFTSCTQYSTEIQEFGDGSNRHGVRLTLLKPQLQDSGHYICTTENKFETQTETVQLSVWLPGVHNIQFRVSIRRCCKCISVTWAQLV